MISFIFILTLLFLAVIGFIAYAAIDERNEGLKGFLFVMTTLIMICNSILTAVTASIIKTSPTPMDVYQGKTILKYTVVDGIITDSTVIFKTEVK